MENKLNTQQLVEDVIRRYENGVYTGEEYVVIIPNNNVKVIPRENGQEVVRFLKNKSKCEMTVPHVIKLNALPRFTKHYHSISI